MCGKEFPLRIILPICSQWLEVDNAIALIKSKSDNSIHEHKTIVVNLRLCKVRIGVHSWELGGEILIEYNQKALREPHLDARHAR